MGSKQKQKNKLVWIAVLVAIGFGFYLVNNLNLNSAEGLFGNETNEKYEKVIEKFVESEEGYLFEDDKSDLTFNYPVEFSYYTIDNEIGYSVVMEDDDSEIGFQINILPWDEGEERLTKERIKKDLPTLIMEQFADVDLKIGDDVLETVTFLTPHPEHGELREVWFAKGGYLYQFSAPKDAERLINIVFGTINFK